MYPEPIIPLLIDYYEAKVRSKIENGQTLDDNENIALLLAIQALFADRQQSHLYRIAAAVERTTDEGEGFWLVGTLK